MVDFKAKIQDVEFIELNQILKISYGNVKQKLKLEKNFIKEIDQKNIGKLYEMLRI
jgi:hypothetical protein